jgi:hypothetical protein
MVGQTNTTCEPCAVQALCNRKDQQMCRLTFAGLFGDDQGRWLVGSDGDDLGTGAEQEDMSIRERQSTRKLTIDELLDLILKPAARRAAKACKRLAVVCRGRANRQWLANGRPGA